MNVSIPRAADWNRHLLKHSGQILTWDLGKSAYPPRAREIIFWATRCQTERAGVAASQDPAPKLLPFSNNSHLTGMRVIDIFSDVKLRDHPVMSYGGMTTWPPVWKPARQGSLETVRGEVGVLAYAHSNPNVSGKCYLVMEYEGETYVGA